MKAFFKSKTIWGIVAMAIPGIGGPLSAAILGMEAGSPIPSELATITAGVGAVLAIYGRWKATGELTLK